MSVMQTTGLRVIGVHCPGFAPSHPEQAVRDAVERLEIAYPVLIDSEFEVWQEYENRGWPARYLFDGGARLFDYHYGEGGYEETELAIQELLGVEREPLEPLRPEDAADAQLLPQTRSKCGRMVWPLRSRQRLGRARRIWHGHGQHSRRRGHTSRGERAWRRAPRRIQAGRARSPYPGRAHPRCRHGRGVLCDMLHAGSGVSPAAPAQPPPLPARQGRPARHTRPALNTLDTATRSTQQPVRCSSGHPATVAKQADRHPRRAQRPQASRGSHRACL